MPYYDIGGKLCAIKKVPINWKVIRLNHLSMRADVQLGNFSVQTGRLMLFVRVSIVGEVVSWSVGCENSSISVKH